MIKAIMRSWIFLSSDKFWRLWFLALGIGFLLIAASVFFVDREWARFFGSPDMVHVWLFHRHITDIGEAGIYLVLALIALLFKPLKKYAAYFLCCMLTSGLVLHLLKFSIGRARAHKFPDHDHLFFQPMTFDHHFQSFPSGHSQTLFTIACLISFIFPKSTWWIMLVALYLAFTRAFTLAHFVSDVWAGSLLGILVSAVTLRKLVQKYGT